MEDLRPLPPSLSSRRVSRFPARAAGAAFLSGQTTKQWGLTMAPAASRCEGTPPLRNTSHLIRSPTSRAPRAAEDGEEEQEEERQQWSHPIEFLLSCIALSVGLGNVWRFPTTAFENGGGAFLIPYLVVLVFIGRPLYFLELALGQFSSSSCTKIWQLAPALKGDQDKKWAPHVACNPCVNHLNEWMRGKRPSGMAFGIPMVCVNQRITSVRDPFKDDISDGIGFPDWG
ncbi:Sodium-dependent nutrient amino acid transporter 1 [Chionoecetes opilio]|uniref:Sodium-dependent nutrient amino acid transporter 1 n=1 Tax=Chionoecetes opilio TaxID=41210 RepID=A0A8J4XWK6_CHIOP|nr:Sodium-dependent nutrient amino acid transporter 1 [Chionoecetes opilio]